jgi:putative tributyrin esterase
MATLRIKYLATSVQMQMHLLVFLPEPLLSTGQDSAIAAPLKVLWLLHGEGGDCSDWTRLSMVEHHAQTANIALVMPNLDNAMAMDMAHGGYPYFSYLLEDLPRHVRSLVRVLSDRPEDNFVAGVSTGGYGAVKWMLRAPGCFAACACLWGELDMVAALREKEASGGLGDDWAAAFGSAALLAGSGDDLLHLAAQRRDGDLSWASIHVASDARDEGAARNQRAAARLREAGAEVVLHETAGESGWPTWDDALRNFIGNVVVGTGTHGRPDVAR